MEDGINSGFVTLGQLTSKGRECRSFLLRSLYLQYEVPNGFTYRNLHGFARFPCDSTTFLLYLLQLPGSGI